jgi:WD40 repeat protein
MKKNAIGIIGICILVGCQGGTTDSPEITAAFTLPPEWTDTSTANTTPTNTATSDATAAPSPTPSQTPWVPDVPGIIPIEPPVQHAASITLENVDNLHEIAHLSNGYFYDAVWSPNGKTLAVARPMGIEFYNAVTGELSGTYGFREAEIIRYTQDGKFLAMAKGTTVWIARMAGGAIERTIEAEMPDIPKYIGRPEEERIQFMAVSPDGKLLALGGRFGHHTDHNERFLLEVWDLASGELLYQYKYVTLVHVSRMEFSSDSKRILIVVPRVANFSAEFWVINASTGERVWGGKEYADYLPDGTVIACQEDSLWIKYDSMGEPKEEAMDMPCDPFTVSKDGERIAFEYEEEVLIWDYVAQEEVSRMKVTGIADAGFSPDGRHILLSGEHDRETYHTDTGEFRWGINSDSAGSEAAFLYAAPAGWEETKGPYLVTANRKKELSLWNLMENSRRNTFSLSAALSTYPVDEILAAPDGRTILFSTDYGYEIWMHGIDSEMPLHLHSCEGSGYYMTPSMQFSADGRKLLIQCPGEAYIMNTTDWTLANRISTRIEAVHRYRGDGILLGMEPASEGIRVWNATSGDNLALFQLGSPPWTPIFELLFSNIVFNSGFFAASETINGYGLVIWDWRIPQHPIKYTEYVGITGMPFEIGNYTEFKDIVFHPFENLLALAYRGDEKIVLINAESGWTVRTLNPVCGEDRWGSVQDLDFSRDGRYLAAACPNGIVWVYGI